MTTLTNDGVLALAERLGIQTMPLVLGIGPRQQTYDAWTAAQRRAVADLTGAGLIDGYGEVDPELADAMYVLAQPDRELVARVYPGDGAPTRLCLALRGERHALALRRGDDIRIEPAWSDESGSALVAALLRALGPAEPADVAPFSAPAAELAERLSAARTSADFTDAVYALGVAERDAPRYGLAFESCRAYAEIVAYAHVDGVTTRPPCAAVVYETGRGRIVVAPGIAPDQQVWSTVTPGTDHRVAQAISGLIETLPGGRWLPQ
ncbi:ESX secretion-associated protein EspG [Nocardia farcinica]|uniref:ESX-1 secretion-associated protein EspG1 n=2 Tax=Nocardia farcinica TaxID=37329 RepID=Q5Z1M5_NOCFA|nr:MULTISPECIES: ESX secretion-associated protein EspG [Nocardia]AXK86406.1 ESX secretion-associated protein EspG [Nocardia farcinica]MBF6069406.1 ESX secretion-associated protein EspG [Nocardia farcinica]MBF6138586.1 ESX secretion-associated protein EspG [Nocardia farcinica]MBF6187484.1 ESX secretion-associated protein EspG [Nocardia farcinica]MBF6232657.1 ESX secretion-associated protein EspG [Nocardia farcinica]